MNLFFHTCKKFTQSCIGCFHLTHTVDSLAQYIRDFVWGLQLLTLVVWM